MPIIWKIQSRYILLDDLAVGDVKEVKLLI